MIQGILLNMSTWYNPIKKGFGAMNKNYFDEYHIGFQKAFFILFYNAYNAFL